MDVHKDRLAITAVLTAALAAAGLQPAELGESDNGDSTGEQRRHSLSITHPATTQRYILRIEPAPEPDHGGYRKILLGTIGYLHWRPDLPRVGPIEPNLPATHPVRCLSCGGSLADPNRQTQLVVIGPAESDRDKHRHKNGLDYAAQCVRVHADDTGSVFYGAIPHN